MATGFRDILQLLFGWMSVPSGTGHPPIVHDRLSFTTKVIDRLSFPTKVVDKLSFPTKVVDELDFFKG